MPINIMWSLLKTHYPPIFKKPESIGRGKSYFQGTRITSTYVKMDHRLSKHDNGVAIKSARGLLLSKPYEREGSFAVGIKNHGN